MTEPSQYFKGRTVQEQMNEVIGYVDTRAAEVATTAIAADVAQVHQDMVDADADAQAAAASAAAAAGTLANAVKKTGEASQSIAGDITVAGDLIAGGDLGVTGDAGVQGQLSVLGGCDLRAPVKVPTVATGTFDDNAVNGTKLKNEMDNYAPLLRTGGFQTASPKEFSGANNTIFTSTGWNGGVNLKQTVGNLNVGQANGLGLSLKWISQDGNTEVGHLIMTTDAQGNAVLLCVLKDKNGTNKYITLASSA